MKRIALFIIMSVFLTSGCVGIYPAIPTTYYTTKMDSIAVQNADLRNKTYTIDSAMKNISKDDIQFKEFAGYVEKILAKHEYKRVDSGADLLVRLAYGIGAPKTTTSSQTYTTSGGYSYPIGFTWVHIPPTTETVNTSNTTYKRFLLLEAYSVENMKAQLWKITAKSTGRNSNLREVLPYMFMSANTVIGKNIRDTAVYKIYAGSPEVLELAELPCDVEKSLGETRLGVTVMELPENEQLLYTDFNYRTGLRIIDLDEGGVAKGLGMEKYDIIISANSMSTFKKYRLMEEIQKTKPGRSIRLTFFSWRRATSIQVIGYLKY